LKILIRVEIENRGRKAKVSCCCQEVVRDAWGTFPGCIGDISVGGGSGCIGDISRFHVG